MTEELVRELARDWLGGEVIQAAAAVAQFDGDGNGGGNGGGGDADSAAVALHQAAGLDHAWLVITAERLAVLRLRDMELECPFEVPRFALESIVRWQPVEPELGGGPEWVTVEFTDASWTRLRTDQAGLRVLTGSG